MDSTGGQGRRLPRWVAVLARPQALSTRTVLVVAVLVVAVVALLLAVSSEVLRRDLDDQYEQRALAIARSVAQQRRLASAVTHRSPDPSGPVQRTAEAVRRATGALYVVVTDRRGIRFSHPTTSLIGERVSTSAREALAGHDVVTIERGTLGLSARGKVPLRAADGTVVGEVSVGIGIGEVNDRARHLLLLLALLAAVPLGAGLVGAVTVGRRLRRTTLGLQPEEMADLVREHAAVLGGVRDGIVAVDGRGRVTVTNDEAGRLLGCVPERGTPVEESGLPDPVPELLTRDPAPAGELCVLGDRVVVTHRIDVTRDGRDLGSVLTLRDRSDLDDLARELEATRALTDALRAQAHEHRNRLHAVAGLLAAKAAAASEAGVRLEVSASTWVDGTLRAPLDVVTVLANLLDNAVRAAAAGIRRPATVEVTLVSDGADLVMHVVDSGDGIPASAAEEVFRHGWTTRGTGRAGHGLGLALALHSARTHGGDVVLRSLGGPAGEAEHGAVFEARMAQVLSAGEVRTP